MTKKHFFISLVVVLLLSLANISLWLFEIIQVQGWYGLSWLHSPLYSPYASCFIAAIAYLAPFVISKQSVFKKLTLPVLLLTTLTILCFEGGKQINYALYCRFCIWSKTHLITLLIVTLLLFVLFGFGYWLVTTKLIKRSKKVNILSFILLMILTLPLSWTTVVLVPGLGSETGWVDAVKMGYPVFWSTFILGLTGLLVVRQKGSAQ